MALCLVLLPLCGWDVVPLLIWALVFAGLVLDRSTADAASFARTYRRYLESPIATYFGSRSYSVYLGHLPIIGVCHWVWLDIFPLAGRATTFFGVSAMVVPLTIIAAEMLYRGIEQPGIVLGSRLARWNMGRTGLELFGQDVGGERKDELSRGAPDPLCEDPVIPRSDAEEHCRGKVQCERGKNSGVPCERRRRLCTILSSGQTAKPVRPKNRLTPTLVDHVTEELEAHAELCLADVEDAPSPRMKTFLRRRSRFRMRMGVAQGPLPPCTSTQLIL